MTVSICVDENLVISASGVLQLAPWAVPRQVRDEVMVSTGDGVMLPETAMPGRMLASNDTDWLNDTPVDHMMLIRVTRRWRKIIVSNPNAIQFRDRWTWAIDAEPDDPVTTGILNGQTGYAGDLGTNTMAEPNPGVFWYWSGTSTGEEWVGPVKPGQLLKVRYKMYVWTPPPWSDNANKNSPAHYIEAGWSRLSLWAHPTVGKLVVG